jgi:hypothetical protein
LTGSVRGVDYATIRADGRVDLDVRAELTTEGGAKIALAASDVGLPQAGTPIILLRENVSLTTATREYSWVNPLQIWGVGQADVARGEIVVRAYVP